MTAPLRVGVVGVGWGAAVQVPAFRAVPDYEVSAICARRPERVAAAAERLGITDTATDWSAFVTRPDLDVISVCTPVPLHRDIAIAGLQAGKHVLCEKPLALTTDDAEAMALEAENADGANAVCFQSRWTAEKQAMRELVVAGRLGESYLCRISATADYWHPTRSLQSEWMYSAAAGGGYLLGLAAHEIDFVRWLFGEPESVCADVRTSVARRSRPDGTTVDVDADDTSVLLLRMRTGLLVELSTSVVALHARDAYRVEAFGSAGTAIIEGSLFGAETRFGAVGDQGLQPVPLSDREPPRSEHIPARKSAAPIRSLALLLEEWVPALRGDVAPDVPTFRDGLRVQQIVEGARRSSDGGGWVNLP